MPRLRCTISSRLTSPPFVSSLFRLVACFYCPCLLSFVLLSPCLCEEQILVASLVRCVFGCLCVSVLVWWWFVVRIMCCVWFAVCIFCTSLSLYVSSLLSVVGFLFVSLFLSPSSLYLRRLTLVLACLSWNSLSSSRLPSSITCRSFLSCALLAIACLHHSTNAISHARAHKHNATRTSKTT